MGCWCAVLWRTVEWANQVRAVAAAGRSGRSSEGSHHSCTRTCPHILCGQLKKDTHVFNSVPSSNLEVNWFMNPCSGAEIHLVESLAPQFASPLPLCLHSLVDILEALDHGQGCAQHLSSQLFLGLILCDIALLSLLAPLPEVPVSPCVSPMPHPTSQQHMKGRIRPPVPTEAACRWLCCPHGAKGPSLTCISAGYW